MKRFEEILSLLLQVSSLSVSILIICNVTLAKIFFKKSKRLHKNVISDIPGNPHSFSTALISLFRTLPEPSNFNIVWSAVPIAKEVTLTGQVLPSRCSSITVYHHGDPTPPFSVDLAKCTLPENKEQFAVCISRQSFSGEDCRVVADEALVRIVVPANWQTVTCSMRNYLLPPGILVQTPVIFTRGENKEELVLRESQLLRTGPAATALRPFPVGKVLLVALLCVLFFWANLTPQESYTSIFIVAASLITSWFLYQACFQLGRLGLRKYSRELCKESNKFFLSSSSLSARASQPSGLHLYWVMELNLSQTKEVEVTASIDPALQKYWSLVMYDQYGVPLPQYFYDANYSHSHAGCSSLAGNVWCSKENYEVKITLGRRNNSTNRNYLDCRPLGSCKKGYAIFRIVHPADEEKLKVFSSPKTSFVML